MIERAQLDRAPGKEAEIRAGLDRALAAGAAVLARGGAALDAVDAAVRVLEDDPNFNAGRGAVLTYDGRNELDAAIMDGRTRAAGRGDRRDRDPQSDRPRPAGDGRRASTSC